MQRSFKPGRPRERFARAPQSVPHAGRVAVNRKDADGAVAITIALHEKGRFVKGNIVKRLTVRGRVSDVLRAIERRLLKP